MTQNICMYGDIPCVLHHLWSNTCHRRLVEVMVSWYPNKLMRLWSPDCRPICLKCWYVYLLYSFYSTCILGHVELSSHRPYHSIISRNIWLGEGCRTVQWGTSSKKNIKAPWDLCASRFKRECVCRHACVFLCVYVFQKDNFKTIDIILLVIWSIPQNGYRGWHVWAGICWYSILPRMVST